MSKSSKKESGANEISFRDFVVEEILIEYDSPLLFVAHSPNGEKWLFKWCYTSEKSGIQDWISFPVSESRLINIKSDGLSLREAITLPEKEVYLFNGKTPFDTLNIVKFSPEHLPPEYLPSEDISVNGTQMGLAPPEGDFLKVRLHAFSELISSEGRTPLALASNLQFLFQQYITWVSHALDKSSEEGVLSPVFDWTGLDIVNVTNGSFKMECESKTNAEQTEKLAKACELLATLSNGHFDIDLIQEQFSGIYRNDVILLACSLAQFISNSKLSMSISWVSSNNQQGYLAIDKRRAKRYFRRLGALSETQYLREITIKLTPEEADPLKKDVNGTGGMESLLRRLKSKLRDDNTITLSADDIEKILRYGLTYGQGGFENKLMGLAMTLRRIGIPFNTT